MNSAPPRAVRVEFDEDATVPDVLAACAKALKAGADAEPAPVDFLLARPASEDPGLDASLAAALRGAGVALGAVAFAVAPNGVSVVLPQTPPAAPRAADALLFSDAVRQGRTGRTGDTIPSLT